MEKLIPLVLPPGLMRNGTKYQAKGRWYDANLVRWFEGVMGPVGGWQQLVDGNGADIVMTGIPRALHAWEAGDGTRWLGLASVGAGTTKLKVLAGGTLTDITPVGLPDGVADGTYSSGNFGQGAFGVGPFGVGSTAKELTPGDVWALDNFGDFLVGVLSSDGKLYVWDGNVAHLATQAAGSPTGLEGVVVTPERFLFALGAGGDGRTVQWPDQESTTDWTPTSANAAGNFPLQTRGRLVTGAASTLQTYLWTTADFHAATYIGGDFIYSFEKKGDNCGIISPEAKVVIGEVAFWMGRDRFYTYDGAVRPLECEISDYVFGDINSSQLHKVEAVAVPEFDEVWFLYPSASQSGTENDRVAVYNYREGHWSKHELPRAAGVGADVFDYPLLVDASGNVFEHERGFDHGGVTPFAESGPVELGDGDYVMRVQRFVPDEKTLGDTEVTLFAAMYPTGAETVKGPFPSAAPTNVRFTARQVRVRVDEVRATSWRVGNNRLGAIRGGAR